MKSYIDQMKQTEISLEKTNMEAKNDGLEEEFLSPIGKCLVSGSISGT